MGPRSSTSLALLVAFAVVAGGCERAQSAPRAASPLVHLADHVADATVRVGDAPEVAERTWSFAEPRPDWRPLGAETAPHLATVSLERHEDGLRIGLGHPPRPQSPLLVGGLAVDLPSLAFGDWETVLVRARCHDRFAGITVTYNLDEDDALPGFMRFVSAGGDAPPLFNDGSVQSYAIPLAPRDGDGPRTALRSLAVLVAAPGPAALEILSVSLVPRDAAFAAGVGARPVLRGGTTRDTLFARTPATLSFPLEEGGTTHLYVGLASQPTEHVTYRVAVDGPDGRRDLLEETVEDATVWRQRTVDIPAERAAGSRLVLEASADAPGAIALWGAPILAGPAPTDRPNVLFYVIDGGGADLMSLYHYGRPTTPFLEELAAEGVVFERAFSNATWTQPSTVSFMTSLHHDVLGGLRRGIHSTPVPAAATTMAEHFRRGGYQTASFTANPNAGRILGLERSVDVLRDVETEHHSTSSEDLHDEFWRFRDEYPGGPWWVHFQTTDVHEPNEPVSPWEGRFVSPEERVREAAWDQQIWTQAGDLFGTTGIEDFYRRAMARAGVPRHDYFEARRGLYDETMLHQDDALRRFVERLREEGEWENTILVVGADHGHPAGTFARWGRGLIEPQPEPWQGALFDAYATRVPLLVIWPGRLPAGRRVRAPVSMIDVLPTVLELAGLPKPEVLQGHSLVPLLRAEQTETPPVVLDEFRVDEATGEMIGNLDLVDGRWGASLEIGPGPGGDDDPAAGRHAVPAGGRWGAVHPFYEGVPRLLLYDLENDPFATRAVNEEHPDLVEKYRRLLFHQWKAHRALATRFSETSEVALTPEQLEQLRTLGYIQ